MQLAQMREMPERVAMMSLADRHGRVPLMERRELADGPGAAFRAFERKVSAWRSERSQLDEELVSMRASVAEISARTVDATEDAKLAAERACTALDALEVPKILEAAAEAKKAIGAAVEASKRDVLCGNQRDASMVVAPWLYLTILFSQHVGFSRRRHLAGQVRRGRSGGRGSGDFA